MKSIAVVTALYVVGSALTYSLEDNLEFLKLVDSRWFMHLGTLIGFAQVASWLGRRALVGLGIVFVCSDLLTGMYEALWRRLISGAGYDWGYHIWTLPEWLPSLVIGAVLGQLLAKRRNNRNECHAVDP